MPDPHHLDKPNFTSAQRRRIRERLLAWYETSKRDLPWRRYQENAYAQLVAEFMLQQTQVAVVVDYYERFLRRFPTVRDLAGADEQEVLALWSGLGYYSRARNLHRTAREIVGKHDGRVPDEPAVLARLPGIGRYTAGAIASIVYGARAPVLDGNVVRVLCRLLLISEPPASAAAREGLWKVAESLLPQEHCGDFNQAVMELGATVCLPKAPACGQCPITRLCRARAQGCPAQIPLPRRRAAVPTVVVATAAVFQGERLLFVRRPDRGLWGGLWALPSATATAGEALAEARHRLRRLLPPGCGLSTRPLSPIRHQLSHREVIFHVFPGSVRGPGLPRPRSANETWFVPADRDRIGLSRATEKALCALDWVPGGGRGQSE